MKKLELKKLEVTIGGGFTLSGVNCSNHSGWGAALATFYFVTYSFGDIDSSIRLACTDLRRGW
ncbi:MAG: hypothetical protein ACKVOQ_19900 [Cyclobacteriaceae bacterium]